MQPEQDVPLPIASSRRVNEKRKTPWITAGGAALLLWGMWTAVDGVTRRHGAECYAMGTVLLIVGGGMLWSAVLSAKGINEREAGRQSYSSSVETYDLASGPMLFGLWLIGLSIYPFTHSSEYKGQFGIGTGMAGLVLGIMFLIGGVQGVMVGYRRRKRELRDWNVAGAISASSRANHPPTAAPPISKAEQIARGRDFVISGEINPELQMQRFEIGEAKKKGSGYLSVASILAFLYWDYRLQQWADEAAETFGQGSKEFREAEDRWDDWHKRLEKAMAAWALICHTMQC
jgi:hypothetical protein